MKLLFCIFTVLFLTSCSGKFQNKLNVFFGTNNEESMIGEEKSSVGNSKNYKLYEVLSTDTIASITRKYRVSASEIIQINNIPKPYYIRPGTLIKIPRSEEEMSSLRDTSYSKRKKSEQVQIGPKSTEENISTTTVTTTDTKSESAEKDTNNE